MFFYSSGLKKLCTKISKSLGIYSCYLDIRSYSDGEIYLNLTGNFYKKNVFIFKNIYSPVNSDLIEALFTINYFKSNYAKSVILVSPYLGYSRQDKLEECSNFIPSKLISRLFKSSGLDYLITIDIHSQQVASYYDFPIINVKTTSLISNLISKYNLLPIFPDYGSYNRFVFSGIRDYIVLSKSRVGDYVSYKTSKRIKGNRAIIIDDIIDTGGTLSKICSYLDFNTLYSYATHAVFSVPYINFLSKLNLSKTFVTNTIDRRYGGNIIKLDISYLLLNSISSLL
ncbi:ribose-phosphate diphosphokinase [Candidatus Vidania fulgoroideorum]